jgi:polysaccharide export outer membrane protein
MRMNEGALEDRGKGLHVVPITPQLLTTQARSRSDAQADPPPPPQETYAYRISPHDVLSVIVWEHPELTIPAGEYRSPEASGYTVSAEGNIFFPHVGLLPVTGRTVEEVRVLLTEKLARTVRDPQLQVLMAAYRGQRAQISGEVLKPSPVSITDIPLRVQDAIALANGFTGEADPANVTLTRGGEVRRLDLLALYERGDLSQNWILRDGDVVYVPDRSRNKVFVLGEVRAPASLPMVKGRMTLADAIGTTGLDPVFSNPAEIFVFRGQYDAPEVYKLDASSPDALLLATAFQLQPRDVVFVSTYNLGRFSRVLTQILPAVQTVWQTWDIVRRR